MTSARRPGQNNVRRTPVAECRSQDYNSVGNKHPPSLALIDVKDTKTGAAGGRHRVAARRTNRVVHQTNIWCTVRLVNRVLAYVRVSTEEQTGSGAGLAAQRRAILSEAARRGWDEVTFVEDAGYSGKSLRRPGIEAALDALKRKKADVLVVSKVDRLSRSLVDFAGLMDRSTKEGWALVALDLGVDTTTPTGEMVANVMATFAQFERRLIGQRTKEALAEKREAGVQLGRPPTVPSDVSARIATAYRSGDTLRGIADALTAEGVPTAQGGVRWYASTVRAILTRLGEARRPRTRALP